MWGALERPVKHETGCAGQIGVGIRDVFGHDGRHGLKLAKDVADIRELAGGVGRRMVADADYQLELFAIDITKPGDSVKRG